MLAACQQEARLSDVRPALASAPVTERQSELIPGPILPLQSAENPFHNNQQAINEGQRLFSWFNCTGCHANHGGGAIGPPLTDAEWIYGSEASNIYETILKGRPNGMPSFAGKIPSYQIWQLVAYVQMISHSADKNTDPKDPKK
jgi:cytochrome c oxidase cbb3-type subunit 3